MEKIWILLVVVHGCTYDIAKVDAYKSEKECNDSMEQHKKQNSFFTTVQAQCATVDYLLEEEKK